MHTKAHSHCSDPSDDIGLSAAFLSETFTVPAPTKVRELARIKEKVVHSNLDFSALPVVDEPFVVSGDN